MTAQRPLLSRLKGPFPDAGTIMTGAVSPKLKLFVLLLATLTLVACASIGELRPTGDQPVELPPGENEVVLDVVKSPFTGVLVFAPVYINDQGPFNFAVDTGASRSVIGRELAGRLNLPDAPAFGQAVGVTGPANARVVRVEQWRVGGIGIPTREAVALDLPDTGSANIEGLLGSDVLSAFDVITIDYERERLVLQPRAGE
jgi:hypothetical protein